MQLSKIFLLFSLIFSQNVFSATYEVSFHWLWDGPDVESGRLPNFAHFTNLVGATHETGYALWEPGELATLGIERVAEDGLPAVLENEVDALIQSGKADQFIDVGRPRVFLGGDRSIILGQIPARLEIEVSEDKPEITLISMIAPSPDWFVGISGFSLFDGNSWVDDIGFDLRPWDAGTENGGSFDLGNIGTIPQEPIELITGSPFVGSPVVARIEFDLLSAPAPIPLPMSLWLLLSGIAFLPRKNKSISNSIS